MRRMKTLAAAAAVMALCTGAAPLPAPPAAQLRIVMLDVEGGGGTLYVTPEGKSLLIDAGWASGMPGNAPAAPVSAERIVKAARALGLTRIDYLIVTHYHADHVGGVADLLKVFPVGTIIDHGANVEEQRPGADPRANGAGLYAAYLPLVAGRRRMQVKAGDHLQIGSMRLDFVDAGAKVIAAPLPGGGLAEPGCATMPDRAGSSINENDASIGIVASFGKARILSLGDTTWQIEKRLVCPNNRLGPIDLVVVSHHGSSLSNSPQLYVAIRPRVALLGNGETKGGDRQVLETLAAAPSKPAVWQLHSATKSPELDVPAERIANPAGTPDAAHGLEAHISADGAIRVINQGTNFTATYPPKR